MSLRKNIEIQAILSDQDGNIIKRFPWKRANSLLKQFIQLLMSQVSNSAQTITDTSNTARSIAGAAENLRGSEGSTATTSGMLIGTGTTPVTMADYKLGTQVTTSITHGIMSLAIENPDASTWRLAASRTFLNNTGSLLSVKEVAWYVLATSSLWKICIDRTLYSVDVPSGITLTITYRLTISL